MGVSLYTVKVFKSKSIFSRKGQKKTIVSCKKIGIAYQHISFHKRDYCDILFSAWSQLQGPSTECGHGQAHYVHIEVSNTHNESNIDNYSKYPIAQSLAY